MSATPTSTTIVGAGLAGARRRDPARRGLRRSACCSARRPSGPARGAVQGLPARRDRPRQPLRAPGRLLRRPRHRAAQLHPVRSIRPGRPPARARLRRAHRLRPAAAGHRRRPAPPPLPGAELAGVHYLRTRGRRHAGRRGRPRRACGGGGDRLDRQRGRRLLRQLGREVTLVGPDTAPLARVLGPEVGRVYRDLHADHGVRLALGTRVAGLRGTAGSRPSSPRTAAPSTATWCWSGRRRSPHRAGRGGRPPGWERGAGQRGAGGRRGGRCLRRRRCRRRLAPRARGTCASSTGRMRSTRARPRPAACSASPPRTRGCPTSTPTSTTWAWSTRGSRRLGPGGGPRRPGRPGVHRLLAQGPAGVVAGMNADVWDVTGSRIQTLIRGGWPVDPRAAGRRHPPRPGDRRRSRRVWRPGRTR